MTDDIPDLSRGRRLVILAAAFLAWAFAGLGIALFVLDHRPMMLDLLGPGAEERVVTRWFAWYQAAFLFGAAAGGWLFGWLGDRVGRARALGWSVLCLAGFTLASYPADTPEVLMALRFLACLGIGGVWPNAVALVAEAWPDALRPFLAGLLGAAANVGQVGMGVLGFCFEVTPASWRWTLVAAALPALFGAGYWSDCRNPSGGYGPGRSRGPKSSAARCGRSFVRRSWAERSSASDSGRSR